MEPPKRTVTYNPTNNAVATLFGLAAITIIICAFIGGITCTVGVYSFYKVLYWIAK
jgi:hypothetical protein